jgi:hypothetical protein
VFEVLRWLEFISVVLILIVWILLDVIMEDVFG